MLARLVSGFGRSSLDRPLPLSIAKQTAVVAGTLMLLVAAILGIVASATAAPTANPTSVTIAGDLQSELGCPSDFAPDCINTHLTYDATDDVWQDTFNIPAGAWEYKAAIDDSWTENYGANATPNGPNITLGLAAPTAVKFYYDHKSHWVTDNINSRIVTAVGDFQSELGCPADWAPDCLLTWLQDPDGDGTYTFSTSGLPPGSYEAKATIDESYTESYGLNGDPNGANIPFVVSSSGVTVLFSFDTNTNILTITTGDICPVSDPHVGFERSSIIGAGMGDTHSARKVVKLVVPNKGELVALYGQLAAKQAGQFKYVRFIYADNSYQQVQPVTSAGLTLAVSWWGADLDVGQVIGSGWVKGRWFLPPSSLNKKLPRAFILYPTYSTSEPYANVITLFDDGTTNWVADAAGYQTQQTLTINIPETQAATSIEVQLAFVDNDRDGRYGTALVRDAAHTTSAQVVLDKTRNTDGKLLDIRTVTLDDVPAGTSVLEVLLDTSFNPPAERGSFALVGATTNYACTTAAP